MFGSIVTWLLAGGAKSILTTASDIGKPIAEAYEAKQKAAVDTHKIDQDTAVALTTADYARQNRQTELSAGLAEIDARNSKNSWMRPMAFLISAYVAICGAVQWTFPLFAKKIGLDVSTMPPLWVYFFMAIFCFIVGFRWYEKGKNADTVVKVQQTIARTPTPISWWGTPTRDQ